MLKTMEWSTVGAPLPCQPKATVSKPAFPVVSLPRLSSRSKLKMLFGTHVKDSLVRNNPPRLSAQLSTYPEGQPEAPIVHVKVDAVDIWTRTSCAAVPTCSAN